LKVGPPCGDLHPERSDWQRLYVTWHAARYYANLWMNCRRYRQYVHHRHSSPWRYAKYWLTAAVNYFLVSWQDRCALKKIDYSRPHFFVPLQLDSDAQIVFHSRYPDMAAFVNEVFQSFSTHAPTAATLIIKQHPLARGHLDMRKTILKMAARHGIVDRVVFIHACRIYELLRTVAGVITVNSTVGVQAISHAVPLKIMGEAIYDHPDVVDQQSLDTFWRNPVKPDASKARQFHQQLKVLTQVPAALYEPSSRRLAWNELIFPSFRGME